MELVNDEIPLESDDLSPLLSALTDRGASKLLKPSYDFDFSSRTKTLGGPSPLLGSPAGGISKAPSKIFDLRDLASSHTDGLKKYLGLSHSEILKQAEASKTRIAKRFKVNKGTASASEILVGALKDNKRAVLYRAGLAVEVKFLGTRLKIFSISILAASGRYSS